MQTILEMIEHSKCEVKKPVNAAFASVLDNNACALYSSDSHASLLGYDPREIVGTCVYDLVHPDDLPESKSQFETFKSTLIPHSITCRLKHKKGHWVDVIVECAPMFLNGELKGFLVLAYPRVTINMERFALYLKRRYGDCMFR